MCFKGENARDQLIAEIDPENTASQRVVEKLGFKRGELLKDVYQRGIEVRAGKEIKRGKLALWSRSPAFRFHDFVLPWRQV
jgi:RimJ/RimL family protein N-acetyltransferase